MRGRHLAAVLALATAALLIAAASAAAFGFKELGVRFEERDGSTATLAGSHPYEMKTEVFFDTRPDPGLEKALEERGEPFPDLEMPDGELKDLSGLQALGLVARPGAVQSCDTASFFASPSGTLCPKASQVGVSDTTDGIPPTADPEPLYSLTPPPGVLLRLGFKATGLVPVIIDVGLTEEPPYRGLVRVTNAPNVIPVYGSTVTLWGTPAEEGHDGERAGAGSVSTANPRPFLTLPRSCAGPLTSTFAISSWQGGAAEESTTAAAMSGCGALPFAPTISAVPTSRAANSPTGLDFGLDLADESIATNARGRAASDIRSAVVTLPEGFSTNPAIAEGLAVCTTAQLAAEKLATEPGEGCPEASKIGTVEAESPLVEEPVKGNVYIAEPYKNEFGTLLAFYFVLRNRNLGIIVRQGARVEPDPVTGRLVTTTEDMPQLPISHVRLHFREGARSPLATPPRCGSYDVGALITPWSGGPPVHTTSTFQIVSGPEGGACPAGGDPPFHPRLEAGTRNNAAGHYSPFDLRLTRTDSEQEFTHFSIKLPPGLTGKLAGVGTCPDADIARAADPARTGAEEEAAPSCPASSQVGSLLVGAGVGPALTYAGGRVYLAGPYHGSPMSLVAVAIARVGPFDLGTVVQRLALRVDPETAEVFADATGSDPIPHIIKGVLVHARDIRTYTDRPEFTLNPTSCRRTSIASTALGSGTVFGSEADDVPFTATTPFQAASCASLGFKPKLSLRLKGGTRRARNPALKAVLTYPAKGAYANIASAQVTLPHSEFLDQSHIRTVCTRVQFAAGAGNGSQCPKGAVYGRARALTPLLDEPLEGPVFLRSSSHKLPDLVVALHSPRVDFNLIGRIDSIRGGRIRTSFESAPDAPVSRFVLEMQGGRKGLLVNSTDLCRRTNRALAAFVGQNGRRLEASPVVKPGGCKGKRGKKGKKKG